MKAKEAAVKKYVEHYEKLGWKMEGRPVVRRIPKAADGFSPRLDREGKAVLWVPSFHGLRTDHPFYQPGTDQYMVSSWFSRPAKMVKIEISDTKLNRLIEKGTLPKGLKIAE